jgi:hypothetical protein
MTPPRLHRPKFALWRYERNLTLRATAELLARANGAAVCSHETVRTICLPFGDPRRTLPDQLVLDAIAVLTGGAIGADDFVEPRAVAA